MNQSPEPFARRAAKRLVPSLTAAADRLHLLPWTDRAAAAVSMLGGQGAGSGWDDGEIVAAVSSLRGIRDPVVVDCGANSGQWTRALRLLLGSDRGMWVLIEPTEEYLARLERSLTLIFFRMRPATCARNARSTCPIRSRDG